MCSQLIIEIKQAKCQQYILFAICYEIKLNNDIYVMICSVEANIIMYMAKIKDTHRFHHSFYALSLCTKCFIHVTLQPEIWFLYSVRTQRDFPGEWSICGQEMLSASKCKLQVSRVRSWVTALQFGSCVQCQRQDWCPTRWNSWLSGETPSVFA